MPAIDVVLVLKAKQDRVPEIGFEAIAGPHRRHMFIFADPDRRAEKLLNRANGRVLDEHIKSGRRDFRSTVEIHVRVLSPSDVRIPPGDEYLTIIELKENRVPANVFPDHAISDTAISVQLAMPAKPPSLGAALYSGGVKPTSEWREC